MTNYVKYDIINAYLTIPMNYYNKFEMVKQVYNALRAIEIRDVYKQKVCTLKIKDHKVDLPEDIILIEEIAYLQRAKEVNLSELGTECPTCVENTHDVRYPNVISSSGQQVSAILPMLPYEFLSTKFYRKYFSLLQPRNKAFAAKYSCSYCPNLNVECEDTYDILPETNQINTHTIKEGIICLSYLTLAENENEELLIPNDANLFEVIAAYIKYKYWEVEKQMADYMNYNRCNSEYTTAKQEYVVKKRHYIGVRTLDGLDPKVLGWMSQIKVQNLVRSRRV